MTPPENAGRLVRPRIVPRALRSPRVSPAHRGTEGGARPAPADVSPVRSRGPTHQAGHEQQGRQPSAPIKEPTWKWYIPIYFWLGGIAAGSWVAVAAEDLVGTRDRDVVRAGRYLALGTVLGGTALLVLDLGRPERFRNMLRIVRARSAMSLGAWGLSHFGTLTGLVALLQAAEDGLLGSHPRLTMLSRGWLGRTVHVVGLPAALFVGGYTGVLLGSTSTPSWGRRARLLGPLFLASGMSSGLAAVAAVVEATSGARADVRAGVRRRFARAECVALATELVLGLAGARSAATLPSARAESRWWRLARRATFGAGIAAPLLMRLDEGLATCAPAPAWSIRRMRRGRTRGRGRRPHWDRPARRDPARSSSGLMSALLTLGGSLALRFLVTHEGRRSARTPGDSWAFTAVRGGAVAPKQPAAGIGVERPRRPPRLRRRRRRGHVTGRVTIVQEDRVRVMSDDGRGYLFTVTTRRPSLRSLEAWRDAGTRVQVRYRGVPDAGATVERIEPL